MPLAIIFLLLPFLNPGRVTDDGIRWSKERPLTFSDFKGKVPPGTGWAANTHSMVNFTYETVNGKLGKVQVYASFIPEKSWMKNRLPEILQHEQLHFDITEIFTRKFYRSVLEMGDAANPKEKLTFMFKKINADCEEMQDQYDRETGHGVNTEIQEQWKQKVEEMLSEHSPYPFTKEE